MGAVGGVDSVQRQGASGGRREDEDIGAIVQPDDVRRRKTIGHTSERYNLVLKNDVVSTACLVQKQLWLHCMGKRGAYE